MAWNPLEASTDGSKEQYEDSLSSLANGTIPAIVIRNALNGSACESVLARLLHRGHLFDPALAIPEHFRAEAIPEGYYREGKNEFLDDLRLSNHTEIDQNLRIDIGTSLGYRGSDRIGFFESSVRTNELFADLFDGIEDPIAPIYDSLQKLCNDKRVMTAVESDGSVYGKAIIRAHYGGYTYKPHFDSVRNREKRADFEVFKFEHQFAGVLVLQNTVKEGAAAQCIIHRCFWQPEISPYLENDTFAQYAREREIENVRIDLAPGDLYFFNTGCIHEVPGIAGIDPRVVVATFIGYSEDTPEIYVWA